MKKGAKRGLSVALLVIILGCFAYYIHNHISDFETLTLVTGWNLFWLFLLIFISIFVGSETGRELMKPFNVKIGFFEHFCLISSAAFYNIITPFKGGTALRAHYLKKKYNFPYTHYISTFMGATFLSVLIFSILGLISMIGLYFVKGITNILILLVFVACFIVTFFVCLFSPKLKEGKSLWKNRIIGIVNSWHFARKDKKVIFIVILRTLFLAFLAIFSTRIAYFCFGVDVSILGCLFLVSVGSVLGAAVITPGNVGVYELIAVFSALALGITPVQTIASVLLRRVINVVILLIFGPISSYILYKKWAR